MYVLACFVDESFGASECVCPDIVVFVHLFEEGYAVGGPGLGLHGGSIAGDVTIVIMKLKLIFEILIAFIVGFFASGFFKESTLGITYLQEFEINDYSPEFVRVQGVYEDSSYDINLINFECNLETNTCVESPTFITKEGIVGAVPFKDYKIIDKSATRIVAKYQGLAAFHTYTIDLATKKVHFKNEDNDSSSFETYELVDGHTILEKLKSR